MKYVPNILTVLRLLLVPVFIRLYLSDLPHNGFWALLVFLIAGLTDLLDGWVARHFDAVTKTGIVLDPLADKLMLLAVLGVLAWDGKLPFFVFWVMAVMESALMLFGVVMLLRKDRTVVPANRYGKNASLAFTLAVVLLFVLPRSPLALTAALAALGLKLLAFSVYTRNFFRIMGNSHP